MDENMYEATSDADDQSILIMASDNQIVAEATTLDGVPRRVEAMATGRGGAPCVVCCGAVPRRGW
jgi:hypothetical protein